MIRSEQEVGLIMTTDIIETLPWVDYKAVYDKLLVQARSEGEAKGTAEGKAEAQMDSARKEFKKLKRGINAVTIINTLRELEIPEKIIESVMKETQVELTQRAKKRSAPER
jgi:predicted transposase YdaD